MVEVVVTVPFIIARLVAVAVTWQLSQVKTKQINQPRIIFASERGEVGHTGSNIKLEVNNIELFSISSPDVWCGSDGHSLSSNRS